jgi:hypothetical protein
VTESQRKARNETILKELWPPLATRVRTILALLEGWGVRPRLQDGWRSLAEQQEKVRLRLSEVPWSLHNATGADGRKEALAVHVYDDDAPLNPSPAYLLKLLNAARQVGCTTGLLFGLPAAQKARVVELADLQLWSAEYKPGWDALHVEPHGLTEAEAKAGVRPWSNELAGGGNGPPSGASGEAAIPSPAPTAAAPSPAATSELGDRVRNTLSLPPLDQVQGPDGSYSQLHADVTYTLARKIAAGGSFGDLDFSVQDRIRKQFPAAVTLAARQLVMDTAAAVGIMGTAEAFGYFLRVHGDPFQLLEAELRKFILEWKVAPR